MNKLILTVIICFLSICSINGQEIKRNPYSLDIIETTEQYKSLLKDNSQEELIDLEKYIPNIKLDIRYATENNFTKTKIYTHPKAYLVKPAAEALKRAQQELNKKNLGLVIYDGYRPYEGTLYFMEVYPDTTFVANPRSGSIHNRGCAVDLALINLKTGEYLPMPTEFDSFTDAASIDYIGNLTQEQIKNREILINAMQSQGFQTYKPEWWHFNLENAKSYKLKNLSMQELQTLD